MLLDYKGALSSQTIVKIFFTNCLYKVGR